MAKRKPIKVDKRVAARLHAEAKDAKIDAVNDIPIPVGDGIDHARWPAEARKLAQLNVDPAWVASTQKERGDECGYSLRSVQRYETDHEFKAYVNQLAAKVYDNEMYVLWVTAMKRGLMRGDAKFCELYGKARGFFKEVRQIESNVTVTDKRADDVALDDELERLERETRKTVN